MRERINSDTVIKSWMVYAVLAFLLFTRLLAMGVMPLNDKTEARYGEIARVMLKTNNWVTLMQSPNEPFWAKPPLSTWSSALSMKLFGVHAFSARLPALIYALAIVLLVGWFTYKRYSKELSDYACLILVGMPYFFINAGVVMTDPAFVFCVTLCMLSAWLAMSHASSIWGGVFFVGLALGLLAKGPLIGVLVVLPLFLWAGIQRKYYYLWKNIPWLWGSLLMFLIASPWYVLAEQRTPGFLQYFIIGEHFSRFLSSGWTGDKYGFAHAAPLGMIWVFLLVGLIPWLIIIAYDLVSAFKRPRQVVVKAQDGWLSYLLCFILVPLVFFSLSKNIIYTYTFTLIPLFTLLLVEGIQQQLLPTLTLKRCASVALGVGVCCLLLTMTFFVKPTWVSKSQNHVVRIWESFHPRSKLIYWANEPEFSARFYSRGQVKATRDEHLLSDWLQQPHKQYLVVEQDRLHEIPESLRRHWKAAAYIPVQKKTYILYEVSPQWMRKVFV